MVLCLKNGSLSRETNFINLLIFKFGKDSIMKINNIEIRRNFKNKINDTLPNALHHSTEYSVLFYSCRMPTQA